ncbi:MAG TPA: YceI family protein, partial [Gammaproteobacteria bacterium]|nr:YceI family protein [Gammaproteobacteria bacterium]
MRLPVFLLACLLLAAGCQSTPPIGSHAVPAEQPLAPLPVAGASRYALRADRSEVRFLVYKAGALSAFGHNHVIQARNLSGEIYLAPDFRQSGFELTLPVKDFEVDAPAVRAVEGKDFAKQPSPEAIAGTRKNMLGPAELDADQYPEIRVRSVALNGPDWGPDTTVRISLHGRERDLTVPVAIEHCGEELVVSGGFDILQSDFGI